MLLVLPLATLYFNIDETNLFNYMWLFTPFQFPPRGKGPRGRLAPSLEAVSYHK